MSNVGESNSSATIASLRLSDDAIISTNDSQIGQTAVPALNAGASFNFQTSFQAPAEEGQFWIGLCVASVSGETIIENNCSIAVPLVVDRRLVIVPPMLLLLLDEDTD